VSLVNPKYSKNTEKIGAKIFQFLKMSIKINGKGLVPLRFRGRDKGPVPSVPLERMWKNELFVGVTDEARISARGGGTVL
jgi:hypothetical protein